MADYKKIAEALRYCSTHVCNKECGYFETCHRELGKGIPSTTSVGFDAADAIEELVAKVPKWISVEERLPEESGYTIVFCADGERRHVAFAKYQKTPKRWELTGARSYWRVLRWMSLPEPPKGVE